MLDDDAPAAVGVESEGVLYALLISVETLSCATCGEHSGPIPSMLVYKPKANVYDALCLECALIVIDAAKLGIGGDEWRR